MNPIASLKAPSEPPAARDAPRGRDQRLDALRGLMLVVIALEHLGALMYHPLGFVSTAEGFVFLSGYVAGMLYTRLALQAPRQTLWRRAAARAFQIYLFHLAVFVCLWTAASAGFLQREQFEGWIPLFFENPLLALLLGATLLYQPTFLDILPMYCVFILLTPWIIKRFVTGRFTLVFVLSAGAWVGSQLGVRAALSQVIFPGLPVNLGAFDPSGWQLLFVFGLLFGFRRWAEQEQVKTEATDKRTLFPLLSPVKKRPALFPHTAMASAYVAALALFALRHDLLFPASSAVLWPLAEKTGLGPLRVIDFAALAFLVGQSVLWPSGAIWVRWLGYLGRSSLQVFSFNIVCVYALRALCGPWEARSGSVQVFGTFACVAALYLPAWLHQRWRFATNNRYAPSSYARE